jgi:hypothetical protein
LLLARVYPHFSSYLSLHASLFVLPTSGLRLRLILTLIRSCLLLLAYGSHLASAVTVSFSRLTPQSTRLRLKQLNKPRGPRSLCSLSMLLCVFLLFLCCGLFFLLLFSCVFLGCYYLVPCCFSVILLLLVTTAPMLWKPFLLCLFFLWTADRLVQYPLSGHTFPPQHLTQIIPITHMTYFR